MVYSREMYNLNKGLWFVIFVGIIGNFFKMARSLEIYNLDKRLWFVIFVGIIDNFFKWPTV